MSFKLFVLTRILKTLEVAHRISSISPGLAPFPHGLPVCTNHMVYIPDRHLRTFISRHRVVPPMPKTVKYVSGIKC